MKIDFKKIGKKDKIILMINGIEDKQSFVFTLDDYYFVDTENIELIEEFKKWTLNDLRIRNIGNFKINLEHDKYFYRKTIEFDNLFGVKPKLKLFVQPNENTWANPYSILQLANEIEKNSKKPYRYVQEDDDELVSNGFGLEYKLPSYKLMIGKLADSIFLEFEKTYETSIIKLLDELDESSFISYFNFPKEIESACKQYLVYFTDFLKDLGISAKSTLSTHSEQTIFTVIPTDKKHALELIKETLTVYLNLPSIPEVSTINVINEDIGVQQLVSNIQFLKSQLVLGNAILQAKNATIDSLELSNFQLKQILDKKEKELVKVNEGEDIIKGIIKVNKLENKGFSINLGEIVRRIKRKL